MTAIVVILFFLFTFIAWRSPRYGVFIVLATLPSYLIRFSIGPIPTTMLEVMIWALFVITFIRDRSSLLDIHRRFHQSGLAAPTALLLLAATVSVFVSPDLRAALGAWRAYFIDPLLFVVVLLQLRFLPHSHATKHESERLVIDGLAVCALAVSLAVIIQWLTKIGIPPPWDLERRATGLFPYPNANGLLLAPIGVLFLGEKDKRYLFLSLLGFAAMILTKTEAGIIAALAGIRVFALLHSERTRRLTIALGVLVAIIVLAIPNIRTPIIEKVLLLDWSGRVRRTTWVETAHMLRDHAIFGAGLAGYPTVFAPYHTTRAAIEIFQYPHNSILNFWSETGLLGLAAFIWLLLAWYRRTTSLAVHAAMAALLIHGLVDVPYFKNDLAILFWTLIALALYDQKNQGEIRRTL